MDLSEQLGGAVHELHQWLSGRLAALRGRVGFQPAPRGHSARRAVAPPGGAERGRLLLAGAGDLPDEALARLVRAAGGRSIRVRVVVGLQLDFTAAGRRWARQLGRFGVGDVVAASVTTRVQADDEVRAAALRDVDLVVLAADDPRHAAALLQGSALQRALQEALARGAAVLLAGASAALAGDWVLAPDGDAVRPTPAPAPAVLPGLSLLPGWVVDVAYTRSGRTSSFLQALCRLPAGVESALTLEPGALAIVGAGGVEVAGAGAAGWYDVKTLCASAAANAAGLVGVPVTVVPAGHRLDLAGGTVAPVEALRAPVPRA
ncbi:MAG: hypothetical protein IMW98_01085 [Firmicutes bacterium]|nr:hypothetical protein [Bacillota bacterium]